MCVPVAQACINTGEALPLPPHTDDNCSSLSSIVTASDEAPAPWALVRRSILHRSMVEPPVWEVRTVILIAFANRDEHHVGHGRRDDELTCGNELIRWLTVLISMKSQAIKGISLMRRNVSLAILATV